MNADAEGIQGHFQTECTKWCRIRRGRAAGGLIENDGGVVGDGALKTGGVALQGATTQGRAAGITVRAGEDDGPGILSILLILSDPQPA
jgi:hypothetical protein